MAETEVSRRNFLRGAGSIIGGASITATAARADAADPVKITLFDPTGAQEITHLFAARLSDLNNKVIAELAVDPTKWQPHRTMPFIEELLKRQFPGIRFIPMQEFLTYEVLATCMAMAGGRPEYMPVAEAVCKIIIEKQNTLMTSSGGAYQGIYVNGPIAKQIRLNSRFSLFGPNPNHPAGGAIGRCISLVLMNVGGHVAGQGTIAEYGEMRFTGLCFAENECSLPKGWATFAGDQYQREYGTNSTTFFLSFLGGLRPFVHRGSGDEPNFETEMQESFFRAANVMKSVWTANYSPSPGSPGILFCNSMICRNMARIGWTKDKIRARLAELLFVTPEEIKDRTDIQRAAAAKADMSKLPARIPLGRRFQ